MTSIRPLRPGLLPGSRRSVPEALKQPRASRYWVPAVAAMVVAFALFGFGAYRGLGTGSGFIVAPVLLFFWLPVIRREGRIDRGFDSAGLVFLGFGVKMISAFGRLFMVEEIYAGNGDSLSYHFWGNELASAYRSLDFSIDPGRPVPGTGFIRILTGAVYTITGADRFTGFLIYSMFALAGAYFLMLAFVTAVPGGNIARFGLLVFLWPSLVFWPSSIGKESWMLLGIGLAALGAARVLRRRPAGLTLLGIGSLFCYLARPHIAVLVLAALAIGLVTSMLFRAEDPLKSFGFVSKALSILVLAVGGALLAPGVASFLNIDDVGGSGFSQALEQTQLRTAGSSGSSFAGAPIDGLLDYPWAFVTVLFRPFPWEINNVQSAISATEGVLLIGLLAASALRLRQLPSAAVKTPFAAMSIAYVFMFCYVFAFVANFGILVRQRVQLLPFLFVLVALPLTERAKRRAVSFGASHQDQLGASPVGGASEARSKTRAGSLNLATRPLPPPAKRR